MDAFHIYNIELAFGLTVLILVTRWYVMPRLAKLGVREALVPLLAVSTLRYVGLLFLVPGVVSPSMPKEFALAAAYGDLAAACLALLALLAVHGRWRAATTLTWLFAVLAIADHLVNFVQVHRTGAFYHLGSTWPLPVFMAPVMFVSLALVVMVLVRQVRRPAPTASGAA